VSLYSVYLLDAGIKWKYSYIYIHHMYLDACIRIWYITCMWMRMGSVFDLFICFYISCVFKCVYPYLMYYVYVDAH